MREKKIGINNCLWWPCFIQSARSEVSLRKTLSSLIPIGKVQVSKKLIIWLSIGFINGTLCDTVATTTTQNKQNEETL